MNLRVDSIRIRVPADLASQGRLIACNLCERIAEKNLASPAHDTRRDSLRVACTVQRHAPADAIAAAASVAIVKKIEKDSL